MPIRNLTLLAFLLFVVQFSFASNERHERDPAETTFIDRSQQHRNAQLQQLMRESAAWRSFEQAHGNWWVTFNEQTGFPHSATGAVINMSSTGNLEQDARNFLATALAAYEIPVEQLEMTKIAEVKGHRIVKFQQWVQGMRVLGSDVWVRFTQEGQVMAFGVDAYPGVNLLSNPQTPEAEVAQWATKEMPYPVEDVDVEGGFSVLPIQLGENGLVYRPVYTAFVNATHYDNQPARYYTLVDGETGEVYYRMNTIHNCAPAAGSVSVDADITDNPHDPIVNRGLPYLRVNVGGVDYYTDSTGQLDLPNLNAPTQATFYLQGKYAHVYNFSNSDNTPSFTQTLNPGVNTISFNGNASAPEIAGYYHTNEFYRHMKANTPAGFIGMDTVMNVYVEVNTGSCNAFYNGDINFFAPGDGCPSIALISDVVYHEYGHGVNYYLYDYFGGQFQNPALGEGYSDVWAFTRTKEAVVGKGFEGTANSYVRRYDQNRKVYPKDLVGESHADGEIIAGAWWDTYLNLNEDMDYILELFINSQVNTPMAFDGNEGQLFTDILLEVLLYDDNDNNLLNGTPNGTAIINAFALHGITLVADVDVQHDDEPGLEAANQPIDISSSVNVSLTQYLGDVALKYRTTNSGSYTKVPMTKGTGTNYTGQIPAQPEGTIIEYYFEVEDIFGNAANVTPARANETVPNLPYYRLVGFVPVIEEDFDNQWGGWAFNPDGNDDASTGIWDVLSPISSHSNGVLVQTGNDHTTKGIQDNLCAVTGNASASAAVGANDVDDGKTTLQSPVFDLTDYETPAFTYWRWFVNDPPSGANPANDFWKVYISNNGSDWVRVEYTNVSDVSWRRNAILVEDYVTPTSTVMLRFIASDSLIPGAYLDGGSIVEAAVDDLFVLDLETNVGVDDPQATHFNVYPNPTSGQLGITWGSDLNGPKGIQLTDLTGRVVRNWQPAGPSGMELDLDGMADGVYFLQVTQEDGTSETRKIVKTAR